MTKHSNSREIFESLLAELTTSFKTQEDVETEYAEYREFSSSLASGLVSGAEVVGESSCSWPPSQPICLVHCRQRNGEGRGEDQ